MVLSLISTKFASFSSKVAIFPTNESIPYSLATVTLSLNSSLSDADTASEYTAKLSAKSLSALNNTPNSAVAFTL